MRYLFKRPADTPETACGRCIWFSQDTVEGWGRCVLRGDRRWYKFTTCVEYEYDPNIPIEPEHS